MLRHQHLLYANLMTLNFVCWYETPPKVSGSSSRCMPGSLGKRMVFELTLAAHRLPKHPTHILIIQLKQILYPLGFVCEGLRAVAEINGFV